MVVVLTQWRAGFFDKGKQKAKDQDPGACNDPERDFNYRAGCTLLIDPEEMRSAGSFERRAPWPTRTSSTACGDYLLGGLTSARCLCAGRRAVRGNRRALRVASFARGLSHGQESSAAKRPAKKAARRRRKKKSQEDREDRQEPRAEDDRGRSPTERAASARALKPPPGGAAVRMYRIGHGDCFLIAFAGESPEKPAYVLIDCGYKPGSPGKLAQPTKVKEIGKHIIATTGGFVDVGIVTHEHQDHVNGLTSGELPRPQGRQGLVRLDRKSRRTISPISCARSSRTDCSG